MPAAINTYRLGRMPAKLKAAEQVRETAMLFKTAGQLIICGLLRGLLVLTGTHAFPHDKMQLPATRLPCCMLLRP